MGKRKLDKLVEEILEMFEELDLSYLEIERGKGFKMKLYKSGVPVAHLPAESPVVPVSPGSESPSQMPPSGSESPQQGLSEVQESAGATGESHNYHEIKSPVAGTFYRAPAPGAAPFVKEGDVVKPGDTLCIVEAMKVMNEIKSDVAGRVVKILKENAEPVKAGDVLFWIEES